MFKVMSASLRRIVFSRSESSGIDLLEGVGTTLIICVSVIIGLLSIVGSYVYFFVK